MKIKMVMTLETMDQVAAALHFAKTHNVEVDAQPVLDEPQARRPVAPRDPVRRRKGKQKKTLTSTSSPYAEVRFPESISPAGIKRMAEDTRKVYVACAQTFKGQGVARKELATHLAALRGGSYKRASALVSLWLKSGKLEAVQ